jgi:U4/U6.U5 tri-snRNP-associated protein 1
LCVVSFPLLQIAKKIHVEKMMETSEDEIDTQNIVLNDTSEFCRSLGDIPTYGLAGNREEERDELLVRKLLHLSSNILPFPEIYID